MKHMNQLIEVIHKRRAYRSLKPIPITQELIETLANAAQLSPSCFNNQPWNYIFTYEPIKLKRLFEALSKGNEWATQASMIITVCAKKEDDCIIHDREYYLFDTGLSSAFLILQATNMSLVAHPIAGYSPKKVREILHIPNDYMVIALIIVGAHSSSLSPLLSEKQQKDEKNRPARKPLKTIIHHQTFTNGGIP